ncbi:MAG TPA: PAS domain S-box protein [Candidatus Binatia bacterium]|jgi:PAS domain S-box-containing protein|nr:PAS domain S-box protein [Candidatus Binatia bacterium]
MKDGDTAHPTILNVDDDEISRYTISQFLRHAGFVVVEAATGSEAVRLIADTPPELILLDVHLPDMDGFDLCRHLKADPITAPIPVLQRSALFTRSQDQVRGLEGGADGYLTAPVDPEVLLATIKALLRARRAEEAVREAATQYQLLFEKNPTPLWVFEAETLRVLAVNEAALRFLGYPRDEFLGLTLRELRPPEDIPVLLETYARVANHHSTPAFSLAKEMRLRGKDGTLLDAELRWGPLMFQGKKAWLAIAVDIAARKQAEEARAHLAAIVESSEDAILSKTLEGIILSWNTGAERLYGYRAAEVIGQSVTLLMPPERLDDLSFILDRLRRGVPIEQYETVRRKKDGTQVAVSLMVSPMKNAAGQIIGASTIARDLTARRQAEEYLARLFAELQRANAELQQFAYIVAHDLSVPLFTVANLLRLLDKEYRGKLDATADKYINFAVESAKRLQALIRDLLAYMRVGGTALEYTAVDCEVLLQHTLGDLQGVIEESRAAVTHDPLPTVHGNAGLLGLVFQNLIGNALKFRGATPPHVHISARRDDCQWLFSVRDNGIGLDPRQAERIFQVFERLHARNAYPGTGIGLAICKKVVEQHGGRIWVDSEPGKGATFSFTLPAR